jgi:hypothetical protein
MSARQTHTKPTGPIAKKARPRPPKRPKRWYALTMVAAVCIVIVYLGASAHLGPFQSQLMPEQPRRAVQPSALSLDSDESRTGKIVLQTNPEQCELMKFDNDTGRVIEDLKPCDNNVVLDEHGRPLPMGTIHRLDAISRSFFGR